jgi:hypothetical protein
MTISKLRSELGYISGRAAAMASRPLMLLALNQWGGNELAATVAVVFLVTLLAMSISGFDTHRPFYQAYFSQLRVSGTRLSYRTYIASTALQIVIVSPFLMVFVGLRFGDALLALLVTAYFASERLADESQRFLIFDGRRQEWGKCILIKAMLQLAGVFAAVMLLHSAATHLVVASLLVGNLVAYGSKLSWHYLPWQRKAWYAALYSCLNQRLFWILSVNSTLISYFDRVLVMFFQQSDMAVYTILVSCMSVVQNAIEYFFMSFRRRTILQGHLTLKGVFLYRRFYLILGGGAAFGVVASVGMLRLYHGSQIDHIELVPIVLLTQLALAISMLMREIIYWNHRVQHLVMLEIAFVVCSLLTAGLIRFNGFSYEVVLAAMSVFFTLRMGLMIWGVSRAHNKVPVT